MSKLRPEVASAVKIRLVAAEVLVRIARSALHPDDLLRLIDGARRELADAIQIIDAGKEEQALDETEVETAVHRSAANDGAS